MRLVLFLFLFLTIYASMHAVVFWGVRPLLKRGGSLQPTLIGLMAVMMILPIAGQLLDRMGATTLAQILAETGYIWMGYLFLAFALFLPLGFLHLLRAALARFSSIFAGFPRHGAASAATILLFVLALGSYGFYEASVLRTETIRIETEKLPPGSRPLRVIQISDLHLGLLHREETARKVVDRIRELHPDLLLVTGDLVDAQINHLTEVVSPFAELTPPLGKFAIVGNHEVYAGLDQSLDFLRMSGFTLLRNVSASVGQNLVITGVDDVATHGRIDEAALLQQNPPERFSLFLKHRPQVDPSTHGLFDLQLSGHTHRGQIFPFNFLTGLAYPLQDGLYRLPGDALLYTSRGTGTWGPPMRVLSPPEVTVIELIPSPSKG